MAEQQQFKTTLRKPDLEVNYKEALTAKVDELLEQCDVKKVETIKKESINLVLTNIVLRTNKTKSKTFDQRRNSPRKYKERGLLSGTEGTLEDNLIPGLDYHKGYHDEQYELFKKLSDRFPGTGFLTNTKQEKDEKGLWFLYRKGQKLTTIKFLNFIDKISLKYVEELKGFDVKTLTPSGIEKKDNELQTIAMSCQTIVMGRYLADKLSKTDFMKVEEYKSWQKHFAVFISFAALLVILEMLKLKLHPKSKHGPTNRNTFPVLLFIGFSVILLVVLVGSRKR